MCQHRWALSFVDPQFYDLSTAKDGPAIFGFSQSSLEKVLVKRALDYRAHSMALRAMLIDLERLVARGCSHSDDACFSAAAAHFMLPS
jgi:hypothetical protein